MDIDEAGKPDIPDVIHPLLTTGEPQPVEKKSRIRRIRERIDPGEDLDRWLMEDRVTISPEARRRYQAMLSAKRNHPFEN